MAIIMGDSFDLEANAAALTTSGNWTSCTGGGVNATTRFSFGQSYYLGAGASLYRDGLPASSNTVFFAFAFYMPSGSSVVVQGRDASSNQFSLKFNSDGSINVLTGAYNGTVVATFAGAFTPGVWTHFQIEVIVHVSAGEVHIRKNGNTVDDFAATALNTRGGTTNNYLTGVGFYQYSGWAGTPYFDDFLFFDNSGTTCNTWCGDVRCYVLYPNGNTAQKDFTPNPVVNVYNTSVSPSARTANTLYMMPSGGVVFPQSGTLSKLTVQFGSAMTGHFNAAIYDALASNVLAVGTAVNNPAAGAVDIVFSTPLAVTAGTIYRVAHNGDAVYTLVGTSMLWAAAVPYAYSGGFNSGPAVTGVTQYAPNLTLTMTPYNYGSVAENGAADGDASYNYSSTVNAEDLYTLQTLPTTAGIVYAQLRVTARKSDSGSRSMQTVLVSGATTDLGASTPLGTSYTVLTKPYPTDPNTGAAWTAAAINAVTAGQKVSA